MKEITSEEKTVIIKRSGDGKLTLKIAKMIGKDNRAVKKYVADSKADRKRSGKGEMKLVSKRKLSLIKRVLNKNPIANEMQGTPPSWKMCQARHMTSIKEQP